MQYDFHAIDRCNMCGSRAAKVMGKRLNRPQGLRPARRIGVSTTVVTCRSCGLIYSNPQPVPASIDQHYGLDPSEYWTDAGPSRNFAHQIGVFERLHAGDRIALDVGAGTGETLVALEQAGFAARGIEPSEAFRRVGLERGLQIEPDGVEDAEFESETFTLVCFSAVLEHVYDPAAAIDKAVRWLRPGGLVHVEVPSARWLTSRIVNALYRLRGLDYVCNISPMHRPFHLYEFTLRSFTAHSGSNRYQIAESRVWPGANSFLPVPGLLRLMDRTGTGMQLEVWLRKH